MLFVHWPFGHALGEPGNVNQQYTILHDLFSMARSVPTPGLVLELPYRWKRENYLPISSWETDSEAFASALAKAVAQGDSLA